jgi:ParB family chromosome partitioning protein
MTIQYLPLSKLVPCPANVRKTDRMSGIEQLAASIAAHGLLQNLQVKPNTKGLFEVVAGGRRLAALALMAKQKKIASDFLVPCNALAVENPAEISLAENEIRRAMHPADQFDAFKALAEQGISDEDVAARFGVSVAVVRQRLKLSRVSPKLIALYRKGDMTLDCLMAFAISDDHKQQEKIWKDLPEWSKEDAHAVRDTLTEAHVEADSKLARFVTVDVYQAAGGAVLRDLFDADSTGWITDPALLNRLASEKLEGEAESVRAQGWQWVEIVPDLAWDTLRSFDRMQPTPTKQQQTALDKLQDQISEIEDEDGEAYEKLAAKREKLESEIAFTAEERAKGGAIVTISADGELEIISGLVRPEDRAAAKKKKAANGEDGDTPPCFSSKLIEDLTAHRTAALQAMLADNPKVALAAVVHAMALGVFYDERDASRLQITPRVVYLDRHAEGMDGTAAAKQLAATTKAMRKRLPKQASKLWAWLQNQQQKTLLALLAVCAGHTVDAVAKNGGDSCEHSRELAAALKLDMADYWQPTAAGYFSRVSKEQTLAAIEDACGASAKGGYVTLKKTALAEAAEAKLQGLRWLPELLRAA